MNNLITPTSSSAQDLNEISWKLERKTESHQDRWQSWGFRGFGIICRTEINYFTFFFVINKQRVMKTRNLKTDMTEFQWWWSNFLNIKEIVTWQRGNFPDSNWNVKSLNMKIKATFITLHVHFINCCDNFSLSLKRFRTVSQTSSVDYWNFFHSDWRVSYVIISFELQKGKNTKTENSFERNEALIIFFLLMKQHCCTKETSIWIAIKRDIEWVWKNIENCGLLFAFNGRFFPPFNSQPCIIIAVQCVAY